MPVVLIVDAQPSEKLTEFLTKELGFQPSLTGFFPSIGNQGDVHWPIKDELPPNIFYRAEGKASGMSSLVFEWAKSAGVQVNRVFAFDASNWFVKSENPKFDHGKPGVNWEDLPKNASSHTGEVKY